MIKKWNVASSEQLESNKVFSVRKDTSVSPITGNKHDFFVVEALEKRPVQDYHISHRSIGRLFVFWPVPRPA